ncbi:uncharacterized protein FIBRA_03002 [Fibroporia radiculosa]|uniref:Uncharacterized protein n=1 Tax=Fibroporia radiculosa TaxID=599839 RepID=J4GN86_9APHY|nr:uncharacterized protein FIBRA_03002 [Fibroporia radiculosa]CCM00955.1 predicted protein [Fibroporia radiculosa]
MNGNDDAERPTERTPLLNTGHIGNIDVLPILPCIEPLVVSQEAKDVAVSSLRDLCPDPALSPAVRTSFSLVVLFYLRKRLIFRRQSNADIWEQWSREQRNIEVLGILDNEIRSVWAGFLDVQRSDEDIQTVLWQCFPYDGEGVRAQREFIHQLDVMPHDFLANDIVLRSIFQTWAHGRSTTNHRSSFIARSLGRLDVLCTPRVLHAVDLLFYMGYLVLFAYFLVFPRTGYSHSIQERSAPDVQEILLIVYTVSTLFQPPSGKLVPSVLVLLAFLSHLPYSPSPNDFAYGVLLFAFAWNVVGLHLPQHPSPLYLLPLSRILPLAVLVWHGVSRVFAPVVVFFLPALLVSLFLLSTSLSDVFLQGLTIGSLVPAPIESRVLFLILISVLLILLLCSLVMLVLVYPALLSKIPPSPWDQYSETIGLEARSVFIRLVLTYAEPYSFRPPFSLVQALVRMPITLASFVGRRKQDHRADKVERVVWRIVVAPLACLIAIFWMWN